MITELQSETNHYICTNISKIAQVECKAKACFLALLRRRRLWSAAQRSRKSNAIKARFLSFDDAKVRAFPIDCISFKASGY